MGLRQNLGMRAKEQLCEDFRNAGACCFRVVQHRLLLTLFSSKNRTKAGVVWSQTKICGDTRASKTICGLASGLQPQAW